MNPVRPSTFTLRRYLLDDTVTASGGEISDHARNSVMADLRSHFRPEFLNRVDDIVLFKPLTLSEITRIVSLQANDIRKRLDDRGIQLEITEAATNLIANAGYDPVYGARPLKRYLQHELETKIGRAILKGDLVEGATLRVDDADGELAVEVS